MRKNQLRRNNRTLTSQNSKWRSGFSSRTDLYQTSLLQSLVLEKLMDGKPSIDSELKIHFSANFLFFKSAQSSTRALGQELMDMFFSVGEVPT